MRKIEKNSLSERETRFIKYFMDELSFDDISIEMNISRHEVNIIYELIKLRWNTFTDVGVTRIAIRLGYYDIGKINPLLLSIWLRTNEVSDELKKSLEKYLKTVDSTTFLASELRKEEFLAMQGANEKSWREFEREYRKNG